MSEGLRIPLTLLQEEMWELGEALPEGTSFNDTVNERLPAPVDAAAVAAALAFLADRHESLRTTFPVASDGARYQSIAPSVPVELVEIDLSGVPADHQDEQLVAFLSSEQVAGMDITSSPPFRFRLVHLGDRGMELVVTLNHMISDRTSLTILLSEFQEAYDAFRSGSDPRLPPLPMQYADFAMWQHGWLTEERVRSECDYWRKHLAGLPPSCSLPFDRQPTATSFFDLATLSASYDFAVPPAVDTSARRMALEIHATMAAVLTAAVKAVIARWSGETDVVATTTSRGREHPELEGVIGLFAGIAVLRTDLADDPPFRVVAARAQETLLGLLENQHVPHIRLFEELRADGTTVDFPGIPLDIQFFPAAPDRWRPGTAAVARPPGEEAQGLVELPEPSKPLSFLLFDDGNRSWGRLNYRADLFDRSTIEGLVSSLERVLEAASADPGVRLSDLPSPSHR